MISRLCYHPLFQGPTGRTRLQGSRKPKVLREKIFREDYVVYKRKSTLELYKAMEKQN